MSKRTSRVFQSLPESIKVNVDKKQDIAMKYAIRSIPTIMLFWKGQPIMR
ncbi:MAG: hypothetical protein JXR87_04555, partial [Candidatus Marinimicrobia bacterium]|nr:hypothetical protein [Candidatus Neomarinimicrobiota bacterium]